MATIEERVTSDGKKRYRAKVRLKGYPPQTETFSRKSDAKAWIQDTESAIRNKRHFATSEAKRHTLTELIDRYEAQVLPQKKSTRSPKQMLGWWKNKLGPYTLADITPALVSEHKEKLGTEKTPRDKHRSAATINRYLATLSHVFTIAVKEWGWTNTNPVASVSKLREPPGRVRFLDQEEREALLAACKESRSKHLYPAVVVALCTGMRKGEILSLRWKDVKFRTAAIIIRDSKNHETRRVPLVEPAQAVLKELSKVRRIETDLVFPSTTKPLQPVDIKRAWESAIEKCGIEDFTFHDLRHTAASYLAMNNATELQIAEILGHKTLAMVKRYSHLSDAHNTQVLESMSKKFLNDA